MAKQYGVYLLSNKYHTTFYVGVTNNLIRRIYEHKNKLQEGFTKTYRLDQLVYYEIHSDIINAIIREKKIKTWSRNKKIQLINLFNPEWEDLYTGLL